MYVRLDDSHLIAAAQASDSSALFEDRSGDATAGGGEILAYAADDRRDDAAYEAALGAGMTDWDDRPMTDGDEAEAAEYATYYASTSRGGEAPAEDMDDDFDADAAHGDEL